jgi:hypothetical protein
MITETKRTCAYPECTTFLSIYNKGHYCSVHDYLERTSVSDQTEESARQVQHDCKDCRMPVSKSTLKNGICTRCRQSYERARITIRALKKTNFRIIIEPKERATLVEDVPTPQLIISVVAAAYGFTTEQVLGHWRNRRIIWARQLTMYLISEDCRRSLGEVAYDTHSHPVAVIRAYAFVARRLQDPKIRSLVDRIRSQYLPNSKEATGPP